MGTGREIVITAYGHDKTIDKISASIFDASCNGATTYCDTLNNLELNGNSWVLAKIISENVQYALDSFLPLKFDIILKLDNLSIQKVLRHVDSQDIARALKSEKEAVKEKIFSNMTKRGAQMLKDDMEYMGPVRGIDVNESQEKIISIILHLADVGEIAISYQNGKQ